MKILVKFPTRGRPEQFLRVLRGMVLMSADPTNVFYNITIDDNDESMKGIEYKISEIVSGFCVCSGNSLNKVDAINRDMDTGDWDIVLLASDDMIPQVQGWDEVVRSKFKGIKTVYEHKVINTELLKGEIIPTIHTPIVDLDQAIWFFDGHQHRICTLVVMGRTRYERFGYLYHPSYISLWCDNEWTEVNQPKKFEQILFKHEHPAWGGAVPMDALYQRNEAFFERDRMNYEQRKQKGFPI